MQQNNNIIKEETYYTVSNCKIYFEDIYMDDIVMLQYQISKNTTPVFGYDSETYDAVLHGSININGAFSINATSNIDLEKILNKLYTRDIKINVESRKDFSKEYKEELKSKYWFLDNVGKVNKFYHHNIDSLRFTRSRLVKMPKNKTFDITIYYGDDKYDTVSKARRIVNVQLKDELRRIEPSGEPAMLMYSFFAENLLNNEDLLDVKVLDEYNIIEDS